MSKKRKNSQLTLVESEKLSQDIQAKLKKKKIDTSDLWVRTPDSEKLEAVTLHTRLCRCDQVCLAVIEDEF